MKPPFVIHDSQIHKLTIGIQVDDDGNVKMVVALCHPNDKFVRKIGYNKVVGMLASSKLEPIGTVVYPEAWRDIVLPVIKDRLRSTLRGYSYWSRKWVRDNLLASVKETLEAHQRLPHGFSAK